MLAKFKLWQLKWGNTAFSYSAEQKSAMISEYACEYENNSNNLLLRAALFKTDLVHD